MAYQLSLSPDGIDDIDHAFEYYNGVSAGLGFEFTDTLDRYFKNIAHLSTATSIRYDNVRVKPIDTFPFTIHFTISALTSSSYCASLTPTNNLSGSTQKSRWLFTPTAPLHCRPLLVKSLFAKHPFTSFQASVKDYHKLFNHSSLKIFCSETVANLLISLVTLNMLTKFFAGLLLSISYAMIPTADVPEGYTFIFAPLHKSCKLICSN